MISLDDVRASADLAGAAILEVYAAGAGAAEVTAKGDGSPLTLADRRSHEVIVAALAALTPDIPVISEEGVQTLGAFPARCWVVDPLDGTKEFINRTDEFTVNIALVEGGVPVLGVVLAPALGVTWLGGPDGATRIQGGRSARIGIEAAPTLDTLRVVASKDHAGPQVKALFARLPGTQAVSKGSSIKFCLVAEGKADLYFRDGPTMEWDTAAAHAVLRAAGGEVYTLDGATLGYGKAGLQNPHFAAVGSSALDWRALIAF